jgi:AhpD family alkylhydroperoxidase
MPQAATTQITKPAPTAAVGNGHMRPRLAPIEKPKSPLMRLIYWVSKRKFGKVPDGMKVVIPRVPKLLNISLAAQKLEKSLRVDKETAQLVALEVATINGCGACVDCAFMTVVMKGLNMEKFNAVAEYRTNPLFPARQRAALAYAEEVTRTRNASDATFAALRPHFNDQEIAELTVVIAFQNMANLINIPLGIGSDGLCAIMQARKR